MKKLLVMLTVFCLMLMLGVSRGFAEMEFVWDANPATDNVTMYQLEIKAVPSNVIVANPMVVPNEWVIIGIPDGSYEARVRAQNGWGWSTDIATSADPDLGWSNVVPFVKSVPNAPAGTELRARVVTP
jgi:hypothetical protein